MWEMLGYAFVLGFAAIAILGHVFLAAALLPLRKNRRRGGAARGGVPAPDFFRTGARPARDR